MFFFAVFAYARFFSANKADATVLRMTNIRLNEWWGSLNPIMLSHYSRQIYLLRKICVTVLCCLRERGTFYDSECSCQTFSEKNLSFLFFDVTFFLHTFGRTNMPCCTTTANLCEKRNGVLQIFWVFFRRQHLLFLHALVTSAQHWVISFSVRVPAEYKVQIVRLLLINQLL